ncbi:MAG TPA: TIGR03000 domain-containing protein [Lacipirellulaceae bacterium]|jgi:uncharacterized protein (TIGR03000 family)|nr:TIGR03000 domain-containing protein [Lacipirellulaceae bacterium]
MTLKKSLFAALVAVTAISMSAATASAHLFGHGSCGSSGGSWGGGWGGSWGSRGSWGSCGSCGGSWGGSYGSGGSWGGYSSCGSCGGGYTVITSSCGSCGGYGYESYSDGGYARVNSRVSTVVASSAPAVKTQLTLHVPADAKVTLAGVETKQTGEVRQFATTKLASGQNWNDYKIVVETTHDGQVQHEERTITLTGGQNEDLAINFTNDSTKQVAQQ